MSFPKHSCWWLKTKAEIDSKTLIWQIWVDYWERASSNGCFNFKLLDFDCKIRLCLEEASGITFQKEERGECSSEPWSKWVNLIDCLGISYCSHLHIEFWQYNYNSYFECPLKLDNIVIRLKLLEFKNKCMIAVINN